MIATSAGGTGLHRSTLPVSGAGIMRAIMAKGPRRAWGLTPLKPQLVSWRGLQHWMKLAEASLGDKVGSILNGLKYWVECNG